MDELRFSDQMELGKGLLEQIESWERSKKQGNEAGTLEDSGSMRLGSWGGREVENDDVTRPISLFLFLFFNDNFN